MIEESTPGRSGLVPPPQQLPGVDLAAWADPVHEAVEAWLRERIANSPVSAVTDAWNQLRSELPDLKARLRKLLPTS